MFSEQLEKIFLEGKERREAYRQFLADRQWPAELEWDGQPHASCNGRRKGTWRVQGWGYYQGSDYQFRWYVAHRCTQCKTMVQHHQTADSEGQAIGTLQRLVIVP